MFVPSADANTSAGAPPWICCTSADDAAKLNVTVVPGFAFSKSAPILVNASVSDAAADTVIVPESFFAFAADATPVAPSTRRDHTTRRATTERLAVTRCSALTRVGTSTTTFVDFTTATARSPGSMPRSSAASRVISDVTRCGPAWMCTTATRPSFCTWVTIPGKRLRADSMTGDSSPGGAVSVRNRARSAPSMRRSPPSRRERRTGRRRPSAARCRRSHRAARPPGRRDRSSQMRDHSRI